MYIYRDQIHQNFFLACIFTRGHIQPILYIFILQLLVTIRKCIYTAIS
jgi:hypothetical protein